MASISFTWIGWDQEKVCSALPNTVGPYALNEVVWEDHQWLIILSRPRGMLTSGEHFISWLALACDWAISSSDGKPAKPVERWVPLSRDRCVTVANWQSCKSAPLKRYLNRLTVSRWPCIHDYFFLPLSPLLILSFLRYTDSFISPLRWRCIINAHHPLFMFTLICCPHVYSFQTLRRFMVLLSKRCYDVIVPFCIVSIYCTFSSVLKP